MRGRKTSNKVKLLTGQERHAKDIPKARPIATFPKPPRHLGKEAKRAWKRLGPALAATNILNGLDLLAFETLCLCYEEMRAADAKIPEEGLVIPDKKGSSKANPLIRIRNSARATFLKLCSQFGMNPDGRQKLDFAPARDDDGELEALLTPVRAARNKWDNLNYQKERK